MHLQRRVISGERIEITSKEAVVLGPDLVVSECHVRLATNANALTIASSRFERCTIEAKRDLVNVRWCNAWIEGSTFQGSFVGCDFGRWPANFDPKGGISACDLSAAVLDGCRFFGEHADGLQFPEWPCITLRKPKEVVRRLRTGAHPGKLQHWVEALSWSPDETKVIVEFAPTVAKRFAVSEDDLRAVLAVVNV
jgi:hypothetical protein